MKKALLATLVAAACAQAVPAAASNYYVVVPVTGKTVSRAAIQVDLSQGSLPAVLRGAAYSYDFKKHLLVTGDSNYSGYGVKWAVTSGTLPPGLTLDASTGVISGVASTGGTWPFAISATYMTKVGQQTYQVAVTSLTVALDAATPPQALVGTAYSFNLAPLLKVDGQPVSGGVTWNVVSSTLAAGLYLTADGRIGGTPTAGGTGTLTARATFQGFQGEQVYQVVSLDIVVNLAAVTLAGGAVGDAYSYDLKPLLSVTGDSTYATSAVTWSVASGSLPAGLALDASTGIISGTPTVAGSTDVQVQATYRGKSGKTTYAVTIGVAPARSSWAQTTLDFGLVTIGESEARTVSMLNVGGTTGGNWTALKNLSGSITGDASACVSVAPGGSCPVTFRYSPTKVESVSLAGVATSGAPREDYTLAITATGVQRILALSPAVNGRTTWNLDVDGPLVIAGAGTWTITPASTMRFTAKLWGGGGGGGGFDAAPVYSGKGGGGGYVGGQYKIDKNVPLTALVGGGGIGGMNGNASGGGPGGIGGGGAGGNAGAVGGSGGGGGGGGRTELLRGGATLACAGGGGGGGGDGNVTTNGGNDGNYTTGATSTKDGGTQGTRADDGGGNGGGGGGCNGGIASSNYVEFDSNGEGGAAGQSSAPGLQQPTVLAPGIGGAPANAGDADVGMYARGGINATSNVGGNGTPGVLVIR